MRVFGSSFCLLSVKYISKYNLESEILDGPDQSEPSVSGLPDTGVSCESQYDEDDAYSDRELGL